MKPLSRTIEVSLRQPGIRPSCHHRGDAETLRQHSTPLILAPAVRERKEKPRYNLLLTSSINLGFPFPIDNLICFRSRGLVLHPSSPFLSKTGATSREEASHFDIMADSSAAVRQTGLALPRVTIQFCTQCKWMLRAAYVRPPHLMQHLPSPSHYIL